MPSARIRLNSTTMFRVMPSMASTMNVISIENGIATATMNEFRTPKNASSTTTTRIRPLMMLSSSSFTMRLIWIDWSATMFTVMPAGNAGFIRSMVSLTSRAIAMRFSPLRFLTTSVTASRPFTRLIVSRSRMPSFTVATSRRWTGGVMPGFRTNPSSSSTSSISPRTRTW
jgi:hypothetical protein